MGRRRRAGRDTAEAEAERVASKTPFGPASPADARPDPALEGARLHRDERAAALTEALGAHAVTAGRNVFFSPRAPSLGSDAGKRLLAHELTHVVQQRESGPRFQCFRATERPQIARDLAAMMAVITALVDASTNGSSVDMDRLVHQAGGRTAGDAAPGPLRSASGGLPYMLSLRYLFTRRCGLVDMRHFIQLMYVSWFMNLGSASSANRGATRRGIEHERTSEPESKFGGEDLTSNALGAWTATRLAGFPQRDDLIARIRETLESCAPVDFDALSPSSQSSVVTFYSALDAAGEPVNQNTTAVALIPNIPELSGADRSFPFELDSDDPNRATISGATFAGGTALLTGDGEIRSYLSVQRDEIIRAITVAERERMGRRLLRGWVADEDLDAFERLYRLADAAGRSALRAVAGQETLGSFSQRLRLRSLVSVP